MSIQSQVNQLIGSVGSLYSSYKRASAPKPTQPKSPTIPGTPKEAMKKQTTQPTAPGVSGATTTKKTVSGAQPKRTSQRTAPTPQEVLKGTANKLQADVAQRTARRNFMDYVKSPEAFAKIAKNYSPYQRQKFMNEIDAERREKDGKNNKSVGK